MTLTIDIPDDVADRVLNAVSKIEGYELAAMQNKALTKEDFVGGVISQFLLNTTRHAEAQDASEAAVKAARDKVTTDIQIVTTIQGKK